MKLLDSITLTEGEQDQVAHALSNPLVKRYLKALGLKVLADIAAGAPGAGQSDAEYIRVECHYKGQLAVLETLYSIQSTNQE